MKKRVALVFGKVKTFVVNHKKAVIAVLAAIAVIVAVILAVSAIKQAKLKSALEAQVGGKWYMSVDMSETSSWLAVELIKIENGKIRTIYHESVDLWNESPDSCYEAGSLDSVRGYRIKGDGETGQILYGKGSYLARYVKGENGEYSLYRFGDEEYKEVEFSDYEKALTMFSCSHANVEVDEEGLKCLTTNQVKNMCLDCGRTWGTNTVLSHDFEETVVKEATCTKEGEVHKKCKRCGETQIIEEKALHNYKNDVCETCGKNKPEKCALSGNTWYTHKEINSLWVQNIAVTSAFARANGNGVYVTGYHFCARCGIMSDLISSHVPEFGYNVVKLYSCPECGASTTVRLELR